MLRLGHTNFQLIIFLRCSALTLLTATTEWDTWWTYDEDSVSGPDYWGLIYPEWRMCDRGRLQSPVDINPSKLLYDPNLKPFYSDKHGVTGSLRNTGQLLIFETDEQAPPVNMSGGPLGAYLFRFRQLHIHFGSEDHMGSEHTILGKAFPIEIQAYGYNTKLYRNFEEAIQRPKGIVAVSVFVHVSNDKKSINTELRRLAEKVPSVMYKGKNISLKHLSLFYLLPKTSQYVTYEGSMTSPGCYETVTWIMLNKPIYISQQDLDKLRDVLRSESKGASPMKMANNIRPVQPINRRLLRTNIALSYTNQNTAACPSLQNVVQYRSNPEFPWSR